MAHLLNLASWSGDAALWLAGVSAKATIVLLLVLCCGWLLRNAHARIRRALWCMALLGVVAIPCVSLMPPALQLGLWSPSTERGAGSSVAGALLTVEPPASTDRVQNPTTDEREPANLRANVGSVGRSQSMTANVANSMNPLWRWIPWLTLVLMVWIVGAAAVMGRVCLGLIRVRRLTRAGTPLTDRDWLPIGSQHVFERHVLRAPNLVQSDEIDVPLTWGFLRPVILMPSCAESWSAEQRRSALLHELSHIQRNDWIIQMLATLACALYWFNPLVWMVARRYCMDREVACDTDVINQGTTPSDYTQHLLAIAGLVSDGTGVPSMAAVAMAKGSQIKVRIMCILRNDHQNHRGVSLLAPMIALVAFLAISLGFISPERTESIRPFGMTETHGSEEQVDGVWRVHSDWGDKLELRVKLDADTSEFAAVRIPLQVLGGEDIGSTTHFQLRRDAGTVEFEGSFLDQGAQRVGEGRFRFVAEPHYVQEIVEMGFSDVTPQDVVMLAIADVSLDYAQGIAALGYGGITVRHLPRLHTYSVTADFIDGLAKAGRTRLTPDILARLRKHDVKPEVVRGLGALGYANLNPQHLIDLRKFGIVNTRFVQGLADAGYTNLTPQQLIDFVRFRVHGAFIREFINAGYTDLAPQQLIDLKRHGVDGGFVRRLADAGYIDLTPDQLIKRRRQSKSMSARTRYVALAPQKELACIP